MKIALPTRKDCKYIRGKLKQFYMVNCNHKNTPLNDKVEFERGLTRLFRFYQLPIPKIDWYLNLGNSIGTENKILGQCTLEGTLMLLTPHVHPSNFEGWLDTLYHEIGHYVLWVDCEKKAREFASKMRLR